MFRNISLWNFIHVLFQFFIEKKHTVHIDSILHHRFWFKDVHVKIWPSCLNFDSRRFFGQKAIYFLVWHSIFLRNKIFQKKMSKMNEIKNCSNAMCAFKWTIFFNAILVFSFSPISILVMVLGDMLSQIVFLCERSVTEVTQENFGHFHSFHSLNGLNLLNHLNTINSLNSLILNDLRLRLRNYSLISCQFSFVLTLI